MTLTLRVAPRTGRAFTGYVLLNAAELSDTEPNYVHIGLKSTAGAPTSFADFDTDTAYTRSIPGSVLRMALSLVSNNVYSGQLSADKGMVITHAPGANVKVYAALSAGDTPQTDPFGEVSPGVLLGA